MTTVPLPPPEDLAALREALEFFTQATQSMETAYRALEQQVHALDAELAEKNRALAMTSDYLESLLQSMSDGVIAVDPHGTIVRFNRAAGQILGYEAEAVVGQRFRDCFGREFTAPRGPQASLIAKSGRAVPVAERDSTMTDRAGQRIGYVKTFQDLSELHALREQMRQVDRLAALGEMAASVAHEIRNPLGGLRGFAELLARDLDADDPRQRLVEKIVRGAQSLDRVVNGLLEFTRPVDLSIRPVDCHALIDAARVYLGETNGVAISSEIPETLRIWADADKMRQVLLNLLLNAVQSTGAQGKVRISAEEEPDHVVLCVADNGCGMPAEQLERIFSPFFTTKEKGTGLGLAICQKIVEGHGGAIWAESELNQGSRVYVRVPRAE